jgi:hypothetical protein
MKVLSNSTRRFAFALVAVTVIGLSRPQTADAQYGAPDLSTAAVGEKYRVEFSGTLWNPDLFGLISSEQFGQAGTKIDFLTDLGYVKTRFKDMRIVLRASRKSKFRIQYTPLVYEAQTTLRRDLIFNGQRFPVAVPIESSFGWKVWRLGYEYDFVYRDRGFVGFLLEARATQVDARLKTNSPIFSPGIDEFATIKAPLPSIGIVGRAYPVKQLAINFEVSGFKVPDIDPTVKANYFDWDLSGTVNLTNNVGLQVGWRKMTTFLSVEQDLGDVKFQGIWFGAALRY